MVSASTFYNLFVAGVKLADFSVGLNRGSIILQIHIAILKRGYLNLIVQGHKSVECRLTKIPCPPFRRIAPGEKVLLKESAGPVWAEAVVKNVIFFENLTPAAIKKIHRKYNNLIMGADDFWQARQNCRFCTLIWLEKVEKITPYRLKTRGMQAWLIREEHDITSLKI